MTDQRVIQTAEAEQVGFYNPTQREIREALFTAFREDMEKNPVGGEVPFMPIRAKQIIRNALDRANCGEFK